MAFFDAFYLVFLTPSTSFLIGTILHRTSTALWKLLLSQCSLQSVSVRALLDSAYVGVCLCLPGFVFSISSPFVLGFTMSGVRAPRTTWISGYPFCFASDPRNLQKHKPSRLLFAAMCSLNGEPLTSSTGTIACRKSGLCDADRLLHELLHLLPIILLRHYFSLTSVHPEYKILTGEAKNGQYLWIVVGHPTFYLTLDLQEFVSNLNVSRS